MLSEASLVYHNYGIKYLFYSNTEDQSRRLSRLSLNLEIPLVPENIDNSNLPTRSTDTVLTGYRGNPANTCGNKLTHLYEISKNINIQC